MKAVGMVLIAAALLVQIAVVGGFTRVLNQASEGGGPAAAAAVADGIRKWLTVSWAGAALGGVGLVLLLAGVFRQRRAGRDASPAGN